MKISRHRPGAVGTAAATLGLCATIEALGFAYAPPGARALLCSAAAGTAAAGLVLFLAHRRASRNGAWPGSDAGAAAACPDARHQDHFPMDALRPLLLRADPPGLNTCYLAWTLALRGHDAPSLIGLLGLRADAAWLLAERAGKCRSRGSTGRVRRTPRAYRILLIERRRAVRRAAQRLTERPPHVSADAILGDLDACIAALHRAAVDAWRTGVPLQAIAQDARLPVATVQQWIASYRTRHGRDGIPGPDADTPR
ncbi:hypothetical protein AB0C89_12000 [Streptomyces sp. NPDC048491]|uniref:hypothetical protein n=1 Tax=unclassified Streptomyces TaxID=2593676 RepID=UPI0034269C1C